MRFSILLPLSLTAACPIWLLVLADFLNNKSVAKTNREKQAAVQAKAKADALKLTPEVTPELPPIKLSNSAPLPVPKLPSFSSDYTTYLNPINAKDLTATERTAAASQSTTSKTTQVTQGQGQGQAAPGSGTSGTEIQMNDPAAATAPINRLSGAPTNAQTVPAPVSIIANAAPEAIAQPAFSRDTARPSVPPSTASSASPQLSDRGQWQLNYAGISESSRNTFSQTAATQMIAMNQGPTANPIAAPDNTAPDNTAPDNTATAIATRSQNPNPTSIAPNIAPNVVPNAASRTVPMNQADAILNSSSESLLAERVPPIQVRPPAIAPVVIPVDETYQLGGGDRLLVTIQNAPEWSGEKEVSQDGGLDLPKVGRVSVKGLTVKRAEVAIAQRYQSHLSNPVISVRLVQARPLQISVFGAAQQPGRYLLRLTDTAQFPKVAQALQAAGGTTAIANLRRVEIRRIDNGQTRTIVVNLAARSRRHSQNVALRDGDEVFIPAIRTANRTSVQQLTAAWMGSK